MELKVTSVNEYKERVEKLRTRGIFLWDTTRKPDFTSMSDNSVEIDEDIYPVATFDTLPFEDMKEYHIWKDSLDLFIKLHQRIPLSSGDFSELKEYAESIFEKANNQEERDASKQAFFEGIRAGKKAGEEAMKYIASKRM